MRKILIVEEQFPYSGGSRTEKYIKYLPEYGWLPIILSKYENIRNQFAEEILASYNPGSFKLYQTKAVPNFSMLNRLGFARMAGILNSILFIPDINTSWFPFAIKEGQKIIHNEKPEIIYSSSPREGVHLIAHYLKKRSGLPWVADFRDLWTLYEGRYKPLTFVHHAINNYIEKSIYCDWSDLIIANTQENKEIIIEKFKVKTEKIIVITNGYDPTDVKIDNNRKLNKGFFKIGFIGNLEKPALCYDEFLQAFANAVQEQKNIKLIIWAKKSDRLIRLLKKYRGVIDSVELKEYVLHQQCLRELQQVDVLLVLLAKKYNYIVPQKLYNYLGLKIPILAIVPNFGSAAKIVKKCRSGFVVAPDNIDSISNSLLKMYDHWRNGTFKINPNPELLFQYRKDVLTEKIAEIFNKITSERKG